MNIENIGVMTMRLSKFLAAASTIVLLAACQPSAETASDAQSKTPSAVEMTKQDVNAIPHAQLPEIAIPQAYRIDMTIDPQADTMSGTVAIDVEMKDAGQLVWIHAKEMTVSKASIVYDSGETFDLTFEPIPLEKAPSGLAKLLSDTVLSNGAATINLTYETPYNQNLNSAYQVKRGDDAYIVTQFEPLGAREAFPSFDEPKFKVPFTLSITSPTENLVLSNTPKTGVADGTGEDGRSWTTHRFAQTRPLPTYLIAFAVGPYEMNDFGVIPPNAVRTTPLELRAIAAKGEGENLDFALKGTEPILTALEEYFGTPYPYEKLDLIAAPDYAFGAMENPGAIVYREYLLLMDENAPLSQRRAYDRVHSHELAHQWFGNLVTPVWWEDIWLNEAFATWMGNKAIDLAYPDANYDRVTLNASLGAMNIDTLSTTRKVREPLARSENVMDQFDGITYRKGGGVLSMFESYLGEEDFQKGVRLHMDRYADDVATGDDFFQSIADGSGNPDVVDAMKSFVDQAGLPLVKVEAKNSALAITQSRYAPLGSKTKQGQSWQIPVVIKMGYNGDIKASKYLVKESETEIADALRQGQPDWIMPNADGAGYYRFTLDSQGWSNLIANLDKLNTREALVTLDSLVAAFRAGEVKSDVFLDGMTAFAAHPEYDVASGSTRLLGFMSDELPESRDDLSRHVLKTYKARFNRIAGTDTVEGNLLAPSLAGLLATIGQDEAIRSDMLKKGSQYLGLDGEAQKDKVAPNMMGLALRETMRQRGQEAYAPLLALAKNGSALEKGAASGALASVTDDAIYKTILSDIVLSNDSPLTGRQVGSVLNGLLASDQFGAQTWEWFKANLPSYVKKVPDVRKGGLPGAGRNLCSIEGRNDVRDFVTANAELMPGYNRSLLQTLESIELCAALKEAKAEELAEALKAR